MSSWRASYVAGDVPYVDRPVAAYRTGQFGTSGARPATESGSAGRRHSIASSVECEDSGSVGDSSAFSGTAGGSRSSGSPYKLVLLRLFVLFVIATMVVRGTVAERLSGTGTTLQPDVVSRPPRRIACQPVNELFHFCEKSNVGYIYHHKKRKCVSTQEDEHFVCYGNGNRFPSLDQCQQHCAPVPRHKYICSVNRVFAPCKSSFFFRKWWFLNRESARCEEWDFKNSTCPSNPKGHHQNRNERECIENCANRRTPLPGCFPEGPGEVCPHEIFNDPYFVHVHSDGVRRCHKSEFQHLKAHRCIDESKRFDTMKECVDACEIKVKRPYRLTGLSMRMHNNGSETWTNIN